MSPLNLIVKLVVVSSSFKLFSKMNSFFPRDSAILNKNLLAITTQKLIVYFHTTDLYIASLKILLSPKVSVASWNHTKNAELRKVHQRSPSTN